MSEKKTFPYWPRPETDSNYLETLPVMAPYYIRSRRLSRFGIKRLYGHTIQGLAFSAYHKRTRRRSPVVQVLGLLGKIVSWIFWAHVVFIAAVTLSTFCLKFVNPQATMFMAYRHFTTGQTIQPTIFVPSTDMPRSVDTMFVTLEDHDFWTHHGISLQAIEEAAARNRRLKRNAYGGSTITQQLARNLYLVPDKTLLRKYMEALVAVDLELVLGKRRILELYENTIEFGPGIFGVGRAAFYHYKKPFVKLSYEQRVRLAVIITSPLRYNVLNFRHGLGMLDRYEALTGGPALDTLSPPQPAVDAQPETITQPDESDTTLSPIPGDETDPAANPATHPTTLESSEVESNTGD